MLRPILYKTFSRLLYGLTIALFWSRFVNQSGLLSVQLHAFPAIGIFWGIMAWFAYLQLDGVRLPKLLRWQSRKRTKRSASSDMADFTDETIISFDDLEEDERIACSLVSDLICCILFFVLSLFR